MSEVRTVGHQIIDISAPPSLMQAGVALQVDTKYGLYIEGRIIRKFDSRPVLCMIHLEYLELLDNPDGLLTYHLQSLYEAGLLWASVTEIRNRLMLHLLLDLPIDLFSVENGEQEKWKDIGSDVTILIGQKKDSFVKGRTESVDPEGRSILKVMQVSLPHYEWDQNDTVQPAFETLARKGVLQIYIWTDQTGAIQFEPDLKFPFT